MVQARQLGVLQRCVRSFRHLGVGLCARLGGFLPPHSGVANLPSNPVYAYVYIYIYHIQLSISEERVSAWMDGRCTSPAYAMSLSSFARRSVCRCASARHCSALCRALSRTLGSGLGLGVCRASSRSLGLEGGLGRVRVRVKSLPCLVAHPGVGVRVSFALKSLGVDRVRQRCVRLLRSIEQG